MKINPTFIIDKTELSRQERTDNSPKLFRVEDSTLLLADVQYEYQLTNNAAINLITHGFQNTWEGALSIVQKMFSLLEPPTEKTSPRTVAINKYVFLTDNGDSFSAYVGNKRGNALRNYLRGNHEHKNN